MKSKKDNFGSATSSKQYLEDIETAIRERNTGYKTRRELHDEGWRTTDELSKETGHTPKRIKATVRQLLDDGRWEELYSMAHREREDVATRYRGYRPKK
jgi:hypothetical protein